MSWLFLLLLFVLVRTLVVSMMVERILPQPNANDETWNQTTTTTVTLLVVRLRRRRQRRRWQQQQQKLWRRQQYKKNTGRRILQLWLFWPDLYHPSIRYRICTSLRGVQIPISLLNEWYDAFDDDCVKNIENLKKKEKEKRLNRFSIFWCSSLSVVSCTKSIIKC